MPTKEYIREYRLKRKKLAIEMLGGKCITCKITDNLQFDHIDPKTKINEIASMLTSNITDFLIEVKKCQLLCYKCHLEKSIINGDYLLNRIAWKHGLSGYINHKCRCDFCKSEYHLYRVKRWNKEKK
jgi:hypothetical protein